ncbi:2-deoxyglucose-6-phosphate phosphatase, putative [Ricinus communis]|uniref:2-deoxyglucose-6-phosphate phosphatase, putative n=1 Tax=Ricinus communis TaxID=3988 RepID=B9SS13_RICCO|nr:2-deoxyglucose-6-phosphate phosphatase, putative [Ricinus communis]
MIVASIAVPAFINSSFSIQSSNCQLMLPIIALVISMTSIQDSCLWKLYYLTLMELSVILIPFTTIPSGKCFKWQAADKLKAVDGLYKVTKWVEDHGLKRAAVTNAPRANAELIISILRLTDFFNALIIGSDCEHPKPHPDPYMKALEALKVSKDHTFVFEDSVSGIKAGVAAGLPVVGLTTGNPEHFTRGSKTCLSYKGL